MEPAPSSDPDLWLVGQIGRPVGRDGECLVHPASGDPVDLDRAAQAPVRLVPEGADPAHHAAVAWRSVRRHGGRIIAAFEGIGSREAIAARTHWTLWVHRRDLPALCGAATWWIDDLIGCRVIQVAAEGAPEVPLGPVVSVIEGAASDFLEIERPGGRRAQIPFLRAFLRGVDLPQRIIRVDLPAGLIDS